MSKKWRRAQTTHASVTVFRWIWTMRCVVCGCNTCPPPRGENKVETDRGPATHCASTSQGAARTTGGSLMITLLRVRRQSCPCMGAHH